MNPHKRNRLIAAAVVNIVLLLVILVAIMIYQIVEICVLDKRRDELKSQIEQYQENIKDEEDIQGLQELIDYYTDGEGFYDLLIEYGLVG